MHIKIKSKIKVSHKFMLVTLLVLTIVGMNMNIGASAKDMNQKYSMLKYKTINNTADLKISRVEYAIKEENICFRICCSSKMDKEVLLTMENQKFVQAVIMEQGNTMKKGSNRYEFNIPALNFKGITSVNMYVADAITKQMITDAMKGEKCSGISIALDAKLLNKGKSVQYAQNKQITDKIMKANVVMSAKEGFGISYTGMLKGKGVSEFIAKYKAKKNGLMIIQCNSEQKSNLYINHVVAGENKVFHLGIPEEVLSRTTTFMIMESVTLRGEGKFYQASVMLNVPKMEQEKKGDYHYTSVKGKLLITEHPKAADFSKGKLTSVPVYDEKSDNGFQVDLRSADISALNIDRNRITDLLHADFDTKTKFPTKLPNGFHPTEIMEIGKNPGLGLQGLHKKGVTGKGIGIAIIDQNLLVDHVEYKDQLKCYEEMHWPSVATQSSMHGPAVASIAVGKSVGVAPEAELYYIAEQHGTYANGQFTYDFKPLAKAIDRVIEINSSLPQDRKIRVISISVGWNPSQLGYTEVEAAVKSANKQEIFVISTSLSENKFPYYGLGKGPMSDPDKVESYQEGLFWKQSLDVVSKTNKNGLLVPMDSRTTASPTGNKDYVHYDNGGLSWSVPYIAGLYALACQVNPKITPEAFWQEAVKSGNELIINKKNKKYNVGKIVNPQKLIDVLSKH